MTDHEPDPNEELNAPDGEWWCSQCDNPCERKVVGEPYEYDTNAGGYRWGSECCEADIYTSRIWNAKDMTWIYPAKSLINEPADDPEDWFIYP